MDEFDKLVENYFEPKEKIDILTLSNLIREELSLIQKLSLINENKSAGSSKGEKLVLSLPKFVPSESWGKPNSEARKQMEVLFRQVGGGASLERKIKFLENLQQEKSRITSPRRIISTLILLESLSACLNAFGSSSAGFVFEGFLAALLGGHQVDDPTTEKGNLPIEDIMAFSGWKGSKDIPMSLKMLKKGGDIKGSYTNLVDAMDDYPQGMQYVVAYKTKEGKAVSAITLSTFVLGRENILNVMSSDRNIKMLELKNIRNPDTGEEMGPADSLNFLRNLNSWEELYPYLQRTAGYTQPPGPLHGEEPAPEKSTPEEPAPKETVPITEGQTKTTWYLTPTQAKSATGMKEIGNLQVSPEALHKAAEQHIEFLNDSVTSLFQAVGDLSNNVNLYFISKERAAALRKGDAAVKNAITIEETMGELTKETPEDDQE